MDHAAVFATVIIVMADQNKPPESESTAEQMV